MFPTLVRRLRFVLPVASWIALLPAPGLAQAPPPPANDNFANRTVVQFPELFPKYTNKVDTTAATVEEDERGPNCDPFMAGTVWYAVTPPVDTMLGADTFDPAGAGFDSVIGVWTGTALATLTPVACSDDDVSGLQSAVNFAATGGTTYLFQVGGFDELETGSLTFNLYLPGAISGTVTDEVSGSALPDICVGLYDAPSGEFIDFTVTDASGVYEFPGLSTTTFKVEFVDFCDAVEDDHASEWYDGKTTEASADPVQVVAATERTGIDASLKRALRKLSVSRTGTGTGTVTSSPAGITCGGDCEHEYPHGTTVTLTPAPESGSTFVGWTGGGCAATPSCTVNMIEAVSVVARFNGGGRSLMVGRTGPGTGTVTSNPTGIDCGTDCNESYQNGTSVTLTAAPAGDSTFGGWSGGCSGTAATCTLTMTTTTNVTATFEGGTILTVDRTGDGTGTVTSDPAGIDCGSDCSEPFAEGDSIVLSATAADGSTFAGWSGGGCSGVGACTVALADDTTVSASFVQKGAAPAGCREGAICGDEENNILIGTPEDDVILGFGGDDICRGQQGDDTINCSTGDDRINGGAGNDVLRSTDGDDRIRGAGGADVLSGGVGNDVLAGGPGRDRCRQGPGTGQIRGCER